MEAPEVLNRNHRIDILENEFSRMFGDVPEIIKFRPNSALPSYIPMNYRRGMEQVPDERYQPNRFRRIIQNKGASYFFDSSAISSIFTSHLNKLPDI